MYQVYTKEPYCRAVVLRPNHSIRNIKIHGCFQLSCLQCVLIRLHPTQNIALCIITADLILFSHVCLYSLAMLLVLCRRVSCSLRST